MELLSLTCGHCGAPLEVPEATRYVTCGYCSSKLEVHRSGGAIYTEVLEAIQKRTEELADEVEILKLQHELERLDREWQTDRESCMIRGKNGSLSEPSFASGIIVFIISIGFGIFLATAAMRSNPFISLVGLLFIALAFANLLNNIKKANALNEMTREYERRRTRVLQAIRNFENARHEVG